MGNSNSSSVNHRFTSASRSLHRNKSHLNLSLSRLEIESYHNCVYVFVAELLLRRSSKISNLSSLPSLLNLRAMTNTYRTPFSRFGDFCVLLLIGFLWSDNLNVSHDAGVGIRFHRRILV